MQQLPSKLAHPLKNNTQPSVMRHIYLTLCHNDLPTAETKLDKTSDTDKLLLLHLD